MNSSIQFTDQFTTRHLGPQEQEVQQMLKAVNADSIEQLIEETIPNNIRLKNELNLPKAISELEFLNEFKILAEKNQVFKSYIGRGYYNTFTPSVIKRNILENPGWYTAYTPYQAEIAQGRLEALINYQTMVCELTGMEIANASLLDEATAAAEAMAMMYGQRKGKKKTANSFFISELTHPQTIDVLQSRATPLGINIIICDRETLNVRNTDLFGDDIFGALLQYPATDGKIVNHTAFISKCHENSIMVAVATDLLALTMLKSPAEIGADIAIGSSQRFGVPMGYGGPHAGFFATREKFKRQIPGRIIGVSVDRNGKKAYRMALQTREQHIKREKATSNICTSQVLLAVIAGMYAVYHGPKGLKAIANRVHTLTRSLDKGLIKLGYNSRNKVYFDTLRVNVEDIELVKSLAENEEVNFCYYEDAIGISLDETVTIEDINCILSIFAKAKNIPVDTIEIEETTCISKDLQRTSPFMEQEVYSKYHSEHEMLRYVKRLENKDISLVHSMISLGSCTMKLNATTEMIPITWNEFANIHPFAPVEQTKGYQQLFNELTKWLGEITGFAGISVQPNSGANGEYAGLMVIRAFHQHNGDHHRNIAIIPASAHGTNPASAIMAGMKVIVVKCDENGNIDVEDLKAKTTEHSEDLACLMVTYPSTHGVFEESIIEICETIHKNGGQVYMDGANMNAQVGLTSPANIGADVCHLNLHKTFCIPHGGGGPGVGPIGVASHLVDFLPGHSVIDLNIDKAINAVSAAPWGSAGILPIPYAYMKLMGGEGLRNATEIAILNANYILNKLKGHYDILYTGSNNRCAHELIVEFRNFKEFGIEVEDVAKRLMDYGFHAPTVSFPVAGTLMIEPTESETKEEIDRFCDALISIRAEIQDVIDGESDKENNVLTNAPHTVDSVVKNNWEAPYSREAAAFPLPYLYEAKVWPTVARIDNAYGDRNLMCTCGPVSDYAD